MGCAAALAHLPDQCPASGRPCRDDPGERWSARPSVPLSLASTRGASTLALLSGCRGVLRPAGAARRFVPSLPSRLAGHRILDATPFTKPSRRCRTLSMPLHREGRGSRCFAGRAAARPRSRFTTDSRQARRGPAHAVAYWHASHVGSSIAQNLGATSSCTAGLACIPAAPLTDSRDDDTALSSPPRPVDFSADVAASVRR